MPSAIWTAFAVEGMGTTALVLLVLVAGLLGRRARRKRQGKPISPTVFAGASVGEYPTQIRTTSYLTAGKPIPFDQNDHG